MSAYRDPVRPQDDRCLVMAALGTFGIAVWCGFVLISGALLTAMLSYVDKALREPRIVASLVGGTLATAAVLGVLLWLFDVPVLLVARMDEGVLEVGQRRRVGRSEQRSFELGQIMSVTVDEHGEDHVATILQVKKKEKHAIFVTRIGDDARKVQAFVEEAVEAWHAAKRDASLG